MWCSFLAFSESAQLAVLAGNIIDLFPPAQQAVKFVLPWSDYYKHPKPDSLIYQLFLLFFLGLFIGGTQLLSRKPSYFDSLKKYALVSLVCFSFIGFFQIQAVRHAPVNHPWVVGLWVSIALAMTSKFFWPEINRILPAVPVEPEFQWRLTQPSPGNNKPSALSMELLCIGFFIWWMLFIPDLQALNARFLLFSNAYSENNTFISGPVFGVNMGLVPDVDIRSLYGVGLPVLFNAVLRFTYGEFSYPAQSHIIMWVLITYYFLWYVFLRMGVRSRIMAFGIFLFVLHLKVFSARAGECWAFLCR